ncbi:hypothetical protein PR202_gb25752 [Eleusine coracana subsp. coracana]|uniref:Thioredoxin superfamily protein n=1 Tax=Eleusine coracana subsp. coracana TaxID=191504 RepID=A0AAV5FM56_ELECO|nr:hypothetical protein PR202_gb25752 [Eleusine coracana subsp. coracana]
METKNHHVFLLQLVIIGCWVCCVCLAQIPIPSRMDGFVYGRKSPAWGETVVVEAFFDPVCPDSRDAWPVLKKAVEHYGSRVSVVVHLSPLPYHSNAFTACRSINVANKLNPTFVYPLLERFFKYQNGCARGVTGTPNFFVNGIPLSDSGSPLNYNKWISILDPLVGKM